MKLRIIKTKKFTKSFDKLFSSGKLKLDAFHLVVNMISERKILDSRYLDHKLSGEMEGLRECHIRPDVLLIYQIIEDKLVLILLEIGSHSELFK